MIRRAGRYAWASPYTALGLAVGLVALATGGRVRRLDGVLEFSGGFAKWVVRRLPTGKNTAAFTLGHTVLGQTIDSLDFAHTHELVHVRQFERWGPLMGPAYLGASVWVWLRGGRAYRDNPFEVEAYRIAP
ncbi:hypothetical protein [Botrimarina sp.]|uniref:hypothetical protein n=1 Tax=Botrimarina sp. TaxID=2795802 RepID=UPI0032EFF8F2